MQLIMLVKKVMVEVSLVISIGKNKEYKKRKKVIDIFE